MKTYTRSEAENISKSKALLCEDKWVCIENGQILPAKIDGEDPSEYENWRAELLGLKE